MKLLGRVWLVGALSPLLLLANTSVVNALVDSGDISVDAIVPGPPPASPPVINQPQPNQTFSQKNITVSGDCIDDLIVKVFSNDIFVGSTVCQNDNTFSLPIDLFLDKNDLIARQYDLINQPSADSSTVTVFYIPPAEQPNLPGEQAEQPASPPVANFQLTIDYDYTSHGVFVNQPFRLPLHFIGGTGPYTVSLDWGDGSVNNFVRQNTDKFTTEYTYTRPGLYAVKIEIKDKNGDEAFLQFVVLVHGNTDSPWVTQLFSELTKPDFTNPTFITFSLILFTAGLGVGLGTFGLIRFVRIRWLKNRQK